jgi:hypothetical protein
MYKENEIKIKFLGGETYKYFVLPFERLEQMPPNLPGLYSWHLRVKPERLNDTREIIEQLFMHNSLTAEVSGPMRYNYKGKLIKDTKIISENTSEMMRSMFLLIPYPLYIGITRDMKSRLSRHKKQILDAINKNDLEISEFPDREVNSDSLEESRWFGERIGSLFRRVGPSLTDCLYVRYGIHSDAETDEYMDNEILKEKVWLDLKESESVANSMFNPVFGRR